MNDINVKRLFPIKKKNYKGFFFILGFHIQTENFLVGIKKGTDVTQVGTFSKGLNKDEKQSLIQAIKRNQVNNNKETIFVDPGICVELVFKTIKNNQLLNPTFKSFELELQWEKCTWDKLILDNTLLQNQIKITHPEKKIWQQPMIYKESLLSYFIQVAPFMMPFLKRRTLTTIRYPHGVPGESFYQKNAPDYTPSFIQTKAMDGINYIVCDDLTTLLWLGNQLVIEFHVPFQTIESDRPLEIVFDLDPPNRSSFPLAIKAAQEIKTILDRLQIISFPKLSGSKGIQIHIPIYNHSLTYDETRIFTTFIANYLVEKYPNHFTIERMKKNRGAKLYIDYIQHAEGKTIICPYSPRGKENATIAAPLYWEEVNEDLKLEKYNIPYVIKRLASGHCPMSHFFEEENPLLLSVISSLKEKMTI